jgi:transposase
VLACFEPPLSEAYLSVQRKQHEGSCASHRPNLGKFRRVAQEVLKQDPFAGHLFALRGKRGDLVNVLYWDVQGFCLFAKRLEKGRFVWPVTKEGSGHTHPGAAVDVAGRHRLARPTTHSAPALQLV